MQLVNLHSKRSPSLPPDLDPAVRQFAETLLGRVRGDVLFDPAHRAMYGVDASNYRQIPVGVVRPKDVPDVITAVEIARQHRVPLLGRGGGTSLAGQCCNTGLVLDFSRYMNQVLQLDAKQKSARVQPGCVLDTLRQQAEMYGLTFGPDPATHNRCTLGGMIGNNSCGVHSVLSEFFGPGPRTEDNVVELEILTYDGIRLKVGPTTDEELEARCRAAGRVGEIYRSLRALRDRHADRIRQIYPPIPRRVSGYNLPALLPEGSFNLARALCGTESTCAIVLEATVALTDHFPERALLVCGYPSVFEAGDDVATVRKHKPVGCEGLDSFLVELMEKKGLHEGNLDLLPEGGGWLLVEFGATDKRDAVTNARTLMEELGRRSSAPTMKLFEDDEMQDSVWEIRESGLGGTAFVPGEKDTWPGWEDSAVPPDRVGDYLRDLRVLLDRFGYRCSLYGHFAHGCIHTRIDFDLTTKEGIESFKRFTAEASRLVLSYGGSLSGEHGDGQARGDLLESMYGPELVQAFAEFKAIWDPEGKMNPGKVVSAHPRDSNLRLGAGYSPWQPETVFRYPEDGGRFDRAALRCVGVGKCRREGGGTMCPSYMVTREEMHSTRGRAHLLWEMLRGDVVKGGWQNEQVKEALDLCLSCKGCKNDCPVDVDIATYKAEFHYHHYKGKLRPRHAYAFGLIHRWAPLGALLPRLTNFLTHAPGLGRVAKAIAGMAKERTIPRFARHTFRSQFRSKRVDGSRPRVLLWPDTFNNHFYPTILSATQEVLVHAGFDVEIPPVRLCCGRALYDYGMLDEARRLWRKTLNVLEPYLADGTPVVGVEPSCIAAFRDELPNLFPDDDRARQLSSSVFTLGEFLSQHVDGYEPPKLERKALLHVHCHHKSIMGFRNDVEIMEAMGLDVEVLDSGCCGMAGSFGFEADKYEISMAAGERVLLPAVRRAAKDTLLVADGFSCREQVQQSTERVPLHLAELLRLARTGREPR